MRNKKQKEVTSFNEEVMRALANSDRQRILDYLYGSGPSTYSEIMKALGYGIGDSGRFAYHLKKLVDAGLIKQLSNGKYMLTAEGKRAAAILREEESDSPTIIDTLGEFSRTIDVGEFMTGNIVLYVGLSFTVIGGLLSIMSVAGVPAKIEVMGTARYFTPNPMVSLTALAIGLASLWIGIGTLKRVWPNASILELLVYQKYSFLLLSKSRKLDKYFLAYILATTAWITILLIAATI